jgi:hypothetical protein
MKIRDIRIIERRVKGYYGYTWLHNGLVVIHPDQKPKTKLNTEVHELTHQALPKASETQVTKIANLIAYHLWKLGYRKYD